MNKGIAPLVDLFKSMTPAARVTAALLLVVAAVSVTYLFQQQHVPPHVYLMDGVKFSGAELRQMQASLGKAGLEATVEGSRICIPRGEEARYMAALGEAGALPMKPGHHMEKAVQSGGFLRIPHGQQEAAELVAKQQELQNLIDGMRGVEHSAVLIDTTDDGGFPRPKKVVTAAVAVWPDHTRPIDRDTVQSVRQLLVSSVSGLASDAVTVFDMNTNAHYKGNEAPGVTPGDLASPNNGGAIDQIAAGSRSTPPDESSDTAPALRDQAWAWLLMNWQTVSLAGLALVGLLVLRSMVRSTGSDASAAAAVNLGLPPTLSLITEGLDDGADGPAPFAPHQHAGPSLSHELADAVQNDPDAAVSVLRTWIGNAS